MPVTPPLCVIAIRSVYLPLSAFLVRRVTFALPFDSLVADVARIDLPLAMRKRTAMPERLASVPVALQDTLTFLPEPFVEQVSLSLAGSPEVVTTALPGVGAGAASTSGRSSALPCSTVPPTDVLTEVEPGLAVAVGVGDGPPEGVPSGGVLVTRPVVGSRKTFGARLA